MTRDDATIDTADVIRTAETMINSDARYTDTRWRLMVLDLLAALRAPAVTGEAGRKYWSECNDCRTAMWCERFGLCLPESHPDEVFAAPPAAGAPPALVALVLGYREACAHYNAMQNKHEGDWLHPEVVEAAKRVEALHAQIRWHWSPAPAPVAPPADWRNRAALLDSTLYTPAPHPPEESPAPPAVAGGDAPAPVKCLDWNCKFPGGRCERSCYWRRRQEGQ